MSSRCPAEQKVVLHAKGTWKKYVRQEYGTIILLIVGFWISSMLSPFFFDLRFLLNSSTMFMEIGIVALAMTFVIIAGQIDLSVASAIALVGCVTATLFHGGMPMGYAVVIGLLLGIILGFFNGIMVAWLKLPSLAVTLGTLALYRGLAQILMGDVSLSAFPDWFKGIDRVMVGNHIPLSLVIFLCLAVITGLLLHKTVFGRWIYALGTNETAARYSGVPVDLAKIYVFVLSGFASALAGIMMVSRLNVARYNVAMGLELDIITAVLLGGTDIFGGRGSVFGTVIALFLVAVLRTGMSIANIKIENQLAVVGTILIFTIVVSNLTSKWQSES
jgi:rhamnose transport system permease protein